ncbi:MAG: hypothetical protein WAO20_23245, partial [Acidobacteriota bacterium]
AGELFGSVPTGPYWIRLTTDNPKVTALSLLGSFGLDELDGYLATSLAAKHLEFSRVYEGADTLQGQPAETRLAIVNPWDAPVTFRLSLYSPRAGQQFEEPDELLSEPQLVSLPPNGMLRGSVSEIFGRPMRITSGDVSLEVVEGSGVMGVALVQFPGTLMAVTGESPFSTKLGYAPQFSAGSSRDLEVITNLKMINRKSRWNTGKLTARNYHGGQTQDAATVGLWPQRSWEGDLAALLKISSNSDSIYTGSLTIEFAGTAVPGNLIVGEKSRLRFATSFPVQTLPFTEAIFGHLASNPSIFTGISISNPNPRPIGVTVEAYDGEGTLLSSKRFSLFALGQESRLVSELFPDLGGRSAGYLRVFADYPIVGVEIFADWALNYYAIVPPTVIAPIPIEGATTLPE